MVFAIQYEEAWQHLGSVVFQQVCSELLEQEIEAQIVFRGSIIVPIEATHRHGCLAILLRLENLSIFLMQVSGHNALLAIDLPGKPDGSKLQLPFIGPQRVLIWPWTWIILQKGSSQFMVQQKGKFFLCRFANDRIKFCGNNNLRLMGSRSPILQSLIYTVGPRLCEIFWRRCAPISRRDQQNLHLR